MWRTEEALAYLLCVAVFSLSFYLYHLPLPAVLYPAALCLLIAAAFAVAGFLREKKRREALRGIMEAGIELCARLPEPLSGIEESYRETVLAFCGEHARAAEKSRVAFDEMVNYYTLWVHQIKTPIASMRLQLQNEDTELSRKLLSDLNRVEQYVGMVLTYLRLESDGTDFVIREYDLDDIVRPAVKKLSGDFIGKKLTLAYEPLNTTVLTDEKWLSFVIEQLLTNAVKYTPAGGTVSICLEPPKTLCIRDTGIGIAPEDCRASSSTATRGSSAGRTSAQAASGCTSAAASAKTSAIKSGRSQSPERAPSCASTLTRSSARRSECDKTVRF